MSVNLTTIFIAVIGFSIFGSLLNNWAVSRLKRIAKSDNSNILNKQMPKPALLGNKVYEKGQSYRLIAIILNSTKWPKSPAIQKELKQTRFITIFGILFYCLGVILLLINILMH